MKFAICIGNGPSKKTCDLNLIKNLGITWGCNTLDDFVPDNLVVCKRVPLVNLISTNRQKDTHVWTRSKWIEEFNETSFSPIHVETTNVQSRWDYPDYWSSGPAAVWSAAQHGAHVIIMLGYDLWPAKTDENPADPTPWIYQLKKCFKTWKDCSFVQIQDKDWTEPAAWLDVENITKDTYPSLIKLVNKTIEKKNDTL